jgi:two-component system cell cycle response regulator
MSGRILIADPVAANRIVLKVKLSSARYDVVPAASGSDALRRLQDERPDIIILDADLGDMTGAGACTRIRRDRALADVPVLLAIPDGRPDAGLAALSAGADGFLVKPIDEVTLLARVRSLLRAREMARDFEMMGCAWLGSGTEAEIVPVPRAAQPYAMAVGMGHGGMAERGTAYHPGPAPRALTTPKLVRPEPAGETATAPGPAANLPADKHFPRVGLIGGRPADARILRDQLASRLGAAPLTLDRDAALGFDGESDVPDLFVIDVDLNARSSGLRLMSELRSRPLTRHAAFLVLLPAGDSERAATALDLGASDVCHRPLSWDELAIRIRTQLGRKRRSDRMRQVVDTGLRLAAIDPLTGLHNRRYGLHHLDRVAAAGRAPGRQAGVILMDIDHFKDVNDTHGHAAGDAVLTRVAQELRLNLRQEDVVCRVGGEEFLAVLPDITMGELRMLAERLRMAVSRLSVPVAGGVELKATMSLGAALLEPNEQSAGALLERADRALYAAKRAGRNRVAVP